MSFATPNQSNHLQRTLEPSLQASKRSASVLRSATRAQKDGVLLRLAKMLIEHSPRILAANAADLKKIPDDATPAFRDRLTLNEARLKDMAVSLEQVAALADPVGEIVEEKLVAGDLKTRRVRSPLGVIFMIFESRPNVAVEAFSLAFKAGNAVILRGGKESQGTVSVFYELIGAALDSENLPAECVWGITDSNREIVNVLLTQKRWIDVVVPRGGDKLIEMVTETSKIPVIKNDRGLCHLFVDESADIEMALSILRNGKVQRPGVCNSLETLLVHEKVARGFLNTVFVANPDVEFYLDHQTMEAAFGNLPSGSGSTRNAFQNVKEAVVGTYDTEYLDLKMSVRVVKSLDEALNHIERHGSRHSESIVTKDEQHARRFQNEIDAAAVYWNASTRFTDGFQLGLGGELGISTQKLHVRGPVGLKELTSVRWIFDGVGQIRK